MNRSFRLAISAGSVFVWLILVLAQPAPLRAAASELYVSHSYVFASPLFSVKRFDGTTGEPIGVAGTFATSDGLSFPRGLAFGPDGNLYVASEGTNNILKYDGASGAFLGEFVADNAGSEPFEDGLKSPKGIAFGPDGNLYVASNGVPVALMKFDGATGTFLAEFLETMPTPAAIEFATPVWGVTFGPDGLLYANAGTSGTIARFNPVTETFVDMFVDSLTPGALNNPRGMTFGPDGNLYVAGGDISGRVWKYDGTTGAFLGLFVSLADNGGMTRPDGIAFGPDGNLYVSSGDTLRVLRFSGSDGHYLDVFAALDFPLALGPAGLVFHPSPIVPEPGTMCLVACGVLIALLARRTAGPARD